VAALWRSIAASTLASCTVGGEEVPSTSEGSIGTSWWASAEHVRRPHGRGCRDTCGHVVALSAGGGSLLNYTGTCKHGVAHGLAHQAPFLKMAAPVSSPAPCPAAAGEMGWSRPWGRVRPRRHAAQPGGSQLGQRKRNQGKDPDL